MSFPLFGSRVLSDPRLWLLWTSLTVLPCGLAQATNVDADCAAIYGSNFDPVLGKVTAPTPSASRPAKGKPYRDPSFGACVIRATDHATETSSIFARTDYSRRQAFNATNSRFIVYAQGGVWHLYDANTLARIRTLQGPSGDAEPQWHPTDPNTLYYLPNKGGTTLLKLDVEINKTTVAADFASRLPWASTAHIWTHGEGSPSADGRYWCLMAENGNGGMLGVFTYDLQTQQVIGTRAMPDAPNHVSMSPSGRSCVVSDGDASGGIVAWDRTFSKSHTLNQSGEHSDLVAGLGGREYIVFVDFASDHGDMVMADLDTGVRTVLFPTYVEGEVTSYHVSGKAFDRPGWVLISTYDHRRGSEKWLHERIMAVELKADPTTINLAHHHSRKRGYWAEPQATVSRDFTRVLFNSNWGSGPDTEVDAYMIRLPDALLDGPTLSSPPRQVLR